MIIERKEKKQERLVWIFKILQVNDYRLSEILELQLQAKIPGARSFPVSKFSIRQKAPKTMDPTTLSFPA